MKKNLQNIDYFLKELRSIHHLIQKLNDHFDGDQEYSQKINELSVINDRFREVFFEFHQFAEDPSDSVKIFEINKLLSNIDPLKILIADDNEVSQRIKLKLLQRIGYKGDVAINGLEVLDVIQKTHYDVILMDYQMPEINGVETSKLITNTIPKEKQPTIILMSAGGNEDFKEDCKTAGINDFIQKPLNLEILRECLAKIGEKKTAQSKINNSSAELSLIDERKINFLQDIQSNEDNIFLIELIDVFISELPKTIQGIQLAIKDKNKKELLFNAHKLKGSSLTLGIELLSDISVKLENAAKGGIFNDDVQKLGNDLSQKIENVKKELEIIREKYYKLIS